MAYESQCSLMVARDTSRGKIAEFLEEWAQAHKRINEGPAAGNHYLSRDWLQLNIERTVWEKMWSQGDFLSIKPSFFKNNIENPPPAKITTLLLKILVHEMAQHLTETMGHDGQGQPLVLPPYSFEQDYSQAVENTTQAHGDEARYGSHQNDT
ncbi:hypothetical protein BDZ45DRAFT_751974 [Acephala macrosclerotiorum]|nr:hypothetical protein BDZ45DRAFT_751974 [Acephala macrosclerotiorum]